MDGFWIRVMRSVRGRKRSGGWKFERLSCRCICDSFVCRLSDLTCGAMTSLRTELIPVVGLGFLMSRSLSGLSIVTFPMAKGSGLAAMFADRAKKKIVRNTMAVYLVLLAVLMILVGKLSGLLAVVAAGGIFFYYYKMSVQNFGGHYRRSGRMVSASL